MGLLDIIDDTIARRSLEVGAYVSQYNRDMARMQAAYYRPYIPPRPVAPPPQVYIDPRLRVDLFPDYWRDRVINAVLKAELMLVEGRQNTRGRLDAVRRSLAALKDQQTAAGLVMDDDGRVKLKGRWLR